MAEVYVRVGDSVRKGQPIASVFNPEFITTQKGYLEFLKNEAKLQVLREEGRLPVPRRGLLRGRAVQPVEVESCLAQRDHLGVAGQRFQGLDDRVRLLHHMVGVDPDDGVNRGEAVCKLQHPAAAGEGGSHAEDPGDARLFGPRHHGLEVRLEIREIQVGMGVVKLRHDGD